MLFVPAHTLGHVAYLIDGRLFSGDTLFGAGCGRLFEGTPAQMHAALARFAALPDETLVHCGHEYTWHNLRFALELEPGNQALVTRVAQVRALVEAGAARGIAEADVPTIPSTIGEEKATNPMMQGDVATFTATRRKDAWPG